MEMDILTMVEVNEILRGKMYSKWRWHILLGCHLKVCGLLHFTPYFQVPKVMMYPRLVKLDIWLSFFATCTVVNLCIIRK